MKEYPKFWMLIYKQQKLETQPLYSHDKMSAEEKSYKNDTVTL